ncbi:MAG TPA: FGGY family carbohydrate kinase, partial [Chitinophagaceae bacterium]|nr:FGGY family carbohydrate kinase [Chitinophagaceae bacterium]
IDIGTSSIKVSIVDAQTGRCVAAAQHPETEAPIMALKPGWAEQDPESWWLSVKQAFKKAAASGLFAPAEIKAIGIAYQMHGLVVVDKEQNVLRNSIIWCDSRAVPYGDAAFQSIGEKESLDALLNSPGNFTAAKLAWVKEAEPAVFEKIDKVLLPGDFIAMKLTGNITTSASALSEGILWDFKKDAVSEKVTGYFGFPNTLFPIVQPLFSEHGLLKKAVAAELGLQSGIPVSYKAGDQPNNALSLNVLQPGEVAANAGTSGVIYGISDKLTYDKASRVNSFAHVNYAPDKKRIGVLLCINGTGIANRWLRSLVGFSKSYAELNNDAQHIPAGSDGLYFLPFGNGAERMLNNRIVGAQLHGADFNKHTAAHLYRAGQEGIAFAFRYGLDIMRETGMQPSIIRAGKTNMFLSDVFTQAFVNATGVPVELYNSDGSVGAALGAGIGAGIYKTEGEAFAYLKPLQLIEPTNTALYNTLYEAWKKILEKQLA